MLGANDVQFDNATGNPMARRVDIVRNGGDYICLQIHTGQRGTRIFLTEEQAGHLAHRLMSYASGSFGSERGVVIELEPS